MGSALLVIVLTKALAKKDEQNLKTVKLFQLEGEGVEVEVWFRKQFRSG